MRIILLGPPGSGKGTQAEMICKEFHWPHISTGEIFRENLKKGTVLGKKVSTYLEKGLLVPDDVTISIVKKRLKKADCRDGYVLDGFPRSISQAIALEKIAKPDKVVMIDLKDEEIIKRLSKRRICTKCGNLTSTDLLKNGKCEKCGGKVETRKDDSPKIVKERLKKQRLPQEIINFYLVRGVFEVVLAMGTREHVFENIKRVLFRVRKKNDKN